MQRSKNYAASRNGTSIYKVGDQGGAPVENDGLVLSDVTDETRSFLNDKLLSEIMFELQVFEDAGNNFLFLDHRWETLPQLSNNPLDNVYIQPSIQKIGEIVNHGATEGQIELEIVVQNINDVNSILRANILLRIVSGDVFHISRNVISSSGLFNLASSSRQNPRIGINNLTGGIYLFKDSENVGGWVVSVRVVSKLSNIEFAFENDPWELLAGQTTHILDLNSGKSSEYNNPANNSDYNVGDSIRLDNTDLISTSFLQKIWAGLNVTFRRVVDGNGSGNDRLYIDCSGVASANAGTETMPIATCKDKYSLPNVNNGGAVHVTLRTPTNSFMARKLIIHLSQVGGDHPIILGIFSKTGELLARTGAFFPIVGQNVQNIIYDKNQNSLTEYEILGGTEYYFGIWGSQLSSSNMYFGIDTGLTFGSSPFIGRSIDNLNTIPLQLNGGNESSFRFYIEAIA